jgi:tRNA pseudouridine38-40 synthase
VSGSRRVRVDLAYDGTGYAGWQRQPTLPTIQGVLEEALRRLHGGREVRVRGAGRTDAGAHARQQVADVEVNVRLDDRALLRSLQSMLPGEIRPRALRTVPPEFHSRHGARSKTYIYLLDRSASGDPFLLRYAYAHGGPLDLDAIREGLRRLPGRRDWSGFASSACAVEDRVRTVVAADYVETRQGFGCFSFTAEGFLTHMVRNLVGTLLEIGRGRFGPERVDAVLETGNRSLGGATAPARGLRLERVVYQGESEPGELESGWCSMAPLGGEAR